MVKKNYLPDDWKTFGTTFNCLAVFLYDIAKKEPYIMNWNDVFDNFQNKKKYEKTMEGLLEGVLF